MRADRTEILGLTQPSGSMVFAVDLPISRDALGPVGDLARITGWRIHLLHAVAPEPSFVGFDLSADGYDEQARRQVFEAASDQLDTIAADLRGSGFDVEAHVRLGATVETIIANAEQWQAEMIVVIGRKHNVARRLVLGSVAASLVRTSPIPVLVLPASESSLREAIQSFDTDHPAVTQAVNEVTYHLGSIGI